LQRYGLRPRWSFGLRIGGLGWAIGLGLGLVYGLGIGLGITYGYGWQGLAGYRWALARISS